MLSVKSKRIIFNGFENSLEEWVFSKENVITFENDLIIYANPITYTVAKNNYPCVAIRKKINLGKIKKIEVENIEPQTDNIIRVNGVEINIDFDYYFNFLEEILSRYEIK